MGTTPIPIIGVILDAQLDSSGERFTIPEHALDAIGAKDGDEVELVIKQPGQVDLDLFSGRKRLTLTNHAYEVNDICHNVAAGQKVLVYVLRPSTYSK